MGTWYAAGRGCRVASGTSDNEPPRRACRPRRVMGTEIVQSGRTRSQAWRERAGVLVVGAGIVSIIAVYLLLRVSGARDNARDLLPYQALVASLPEADQGFFHALRRGLLEAEAERFRQIGRATCRERA